MAIFISGISSHLAYYCHQWHVSIMTSSLPFLCLACNDCYNWNVIFTPAMLFFSYQSCHLHIRHVTVFISGITTRSGISLHSHKSGHCLYIWYVIIFTSGMSLLQNRHAIFSTSGIPSHMTCYNHHIWHVYIKTGMSSLPHLPCHCYHVCHDMFITGMPVFALNISSSSHQAYHYRYVKVFTPGM